MKVLHLTGEHEDAGGVLSVLRNLQTASDSQQGPSFDVWVREDYQETRAPNLNYVRSRHACASSGGHLAMMLKSLPAALDVRRLVQDRRYDVVHAHSRGTLPVAAWLSVLLEQPVVFTNHNFASRRLMYRLFSLFPRLHTVLLTPNMARYYGIPVESSNISVISACYPDALLERAFPAPGSDDADGIVRFVGVGNIVDWKNWHLMVEAMARLPDRIRSRVRFDHWGGALSDGHSQAYRDRLVERIEAAGLSNQMVLHGATRDVVGKLDQADWFVLPSINEPCSVALMEALACGLPVVVSRSGGSVDIVEEGATGLFFEPNQASDLARALETAVDRRSCMESRSVIRDSVRRRCARYVLSDYLALYERLTGR